MDAGILRGLFTLVMLVLFVGICAWAYSGRRRSDFEAAARLPLGPDDAPAPASAPRHPARDEAERAS